MKAFNILVLIIVIVFGYIAFRQEQFYRQVNEFMNRGHRNTAEMGYALCERVEHLETEHHQIVHDDCASIYLSGE